MNNRSISFEFEKKVWEAENTFYLNAKSSRIAKFIYHYEIYKKILNIPGDILEFGVFKGASFSRFLSFRKILENEDSRRIIGFDDFGSFTVKGTKEDKRFAITVPQEPAPMTEILLISDNLSYNCKIFIN